MNNKLVASIVGLAVCVILAGSVLAPVIKDAQTVTSTELNYSNDSTLFKLAEATDTITLSYASGTVTLNGVAVQKTTNSNILLSDAISVDQFLYQGNWLTRAWYVDSTSLLYPSAFDLVFSEGTVTGTFTTSSGTNSIDMPYTYLYYADAQGNLTQYASSSAINVYVNSIEDFVLSGLYYTGTNSTTYSYIDGKLTVEGDYEAAVSFDSTEISSDLINVTGLTISIGDESFTPYRYMVPAKVVGHEETSISNLFGVIPLLVIVAILLSAVGFISRRD